MLLTNSFFLDIKEIHLAHKYVLDRVHRCEYPYGRGHYGIVFVLSGQAEYRFYTGERITVSDRDVLLLSSSAKMYAKQRHFAPSIAVKIVFFCTIVTSVTDFV